MSQDKETFEGHTLLSIVEITQPVSLDGKARIFFRRNDDYFLLVLSPDEYMFVKRKLAAVTALFNSHLERIAAEEAKGDLE